MALVALAVVATVPRVAVAGRIAAASTPIQHVVFIFQENHSFDNVLGALCVQLQRCDGATTGKLYNGQTIALSQAQDGVVEVTHTGNGIVRAIDGGKMDGFSTNVGCNSSPWACYTQYQPSQIPNVAALATNFAISDRTFEDYPLQSWGSHLDAVAGTLDGFQGGEPKQSKTQIGTGWGCDSHRDTAWASTPGGAFTSVPACVPKPDGSGPYRASPVKWVPTIMDEVESAGLTWKMYVGLPGGNGGDNSTGYGWAICPTFADCLYGTLPQNMVANTQVITDAQNGTLPSFAVVTPTQANSQHNGDSMRAGDNWIGSVVSAIEHGPDWASTAIFLTWDDCGCFYDHVVPPAGDGVRAPMIIVSPYAKPSSTDSTVATFASVLAFTETVFNLPTLGSSTLDVGAYNYMNSFNFSQTPHAPVAMVNIPLTEAQMQAVLDHPPEPDDPS